VLQLAYTYMGFKFKRNGYKKESKNSIQNITLQHMQHNNGVSYGATLRTVPTKYKVFCTRLRLRRKSRFLQGLLEWIRKNKGSHAFSEIIIWILTKTLTSAYFWKRRRGYLSTNILRIPFTYRQQTHLYRSSNYLLKGNKTISGMFLMSKIAAIAL